MGRAQRRALKAVLWTLFGAGVPAAALAGNLASGADLERSLSPGMLVPASRSPAEGRMSPDGTWLAYLREKPGEKPNLVLAPTSGGPSRMLGKGGFSVGSFCFAPDSKRIFYQSDELGQNKIFEVDLADGTTRAVTEGPGQDLHPSLSADGRWLAFDSDRGGNYDIWLLERPTGTLTQLTQNSGPDFGPSLSPDGRTVVYTSFRQGEGWHLWARPTQGGAAYPLTRGKGADSHPVVSPDGRWVVFDSDREGGLGIFRVPIQGGPIERIPTRHARASRPSFLSQGEEILFLAGSGGHRTLAKAPFPRSRGIAPRVRRSPSAADGFSVPTFAEGGEGGLFDSRPRALAKAPEASSSGLTPSRGSNVEVVGFHPTPQDPVGPEAAIHLTFSGRVQPTKTWEEVLRVESSEGSSISGTVLYDPGLSRLEFVPQEALPKGQEFRAKLSKHGLVDSRGEPVNGFTWSFSRNEANPAESPEALAEVPFRLRKVRPGPTTQGVRPEDPVLMAFTQKIQPGTLEAHTIRVQDGAGRRIPGEIRIGKSGKTLRFKPYETFRPGSRVSVSIEGELKAEGDHALSGGREWSFRVASQTPLKVVKVEPEDRKLHREATVTLHFQKPILASTLRKGDFLLEGGGVSHRGNFFLDSTRKILVFQPFAALPAHSEFVLHLPAGLSDQDGNALELEEPLRFSTGDSTGGPAADIFAKHLGADRGFVDRPGLEASQAKPRSKGVPKWSVDVLKVMRRKGYLDPNLAGALENRRALSRYKMGMMIDSARRRSSSMTAAERQALTALEAEFAEERSLFNQGRRDS